MDARYSELKGPFVDQVRKLLDAALVMDEETAILLSRLWESDELADHEESYLVDCQAVWKALDESGRFLPLGWFEDLFVDIPWTRTTRALHAIADTVCAHLVQDQIPESVFTALTDPWERAFNVAFA